MKWKRSIKVTIWVWCILLSLVLLKMGTRVFVGDWFPVNTSSMAPTIIPGDKIWVNKLIFGARIYKNPKFLDGMPLQTFRVKGLRKIKNGDVVVFNAPIHQTECDSIVFRIDYIYVKRCVGVPGDTVRLPRHSRRGASGGRNENGRQNYYGELYVPQKGDTIYLNRNNRRLYRTVIAYETNGTLSFDYHVFKNNYYFMRGDNTLHSYDSRYFGFVPEEFIIGVSRRVLFNNRDGWKQKFDGRRILKRLQ